MTPVGISALALVALWMTALSLVAVLLVRQVGLLTLRVDRVEEGPAMDGISVGSEVPEPVSRVLANAPTARMYLLVLGAECGPCRDLADELHTATLTSPVVALIEGPRDVAAAIARQLPNSVEAVFDPDASLAVESLDLKTTPFVFVLEHGKVSDKAVVRNGVHFAEYLGDGNSLNGGLSPHQRLEVTHVH